MKKTTGVLLAVFVLLAALGIWLEPTRVLWGTLRSEEFFAGRPASYWRTALAGNPAAQANALQKLEHGGPAAVPVLAALLVDRQATSAELRCLAADLLGKLGTDAAAAGSTLLDALEDPDPYVRSVAVASLAEAGVPAAQAVPALVRMLKGPQKRDAACALSEYRSDALPAQAALIGVMQDPTLDSETRWNAARTLGKIGPAGREAVPALVQALRDPVATVRERAAEALGDIGPAAAAAVPDLVGALGDPAVRVRRDAARSLGQMGPPARTAVPEIKRLLDDPETIVRDAAREALRTIAPEELAPDKSPPEEPSRTDAKAEGEEPEPRESEP